MAAVTGAGKARAGAVYALVVVVGAGAFLYPFWLPPETLSTQQADQIDL